MLKHNGKYTQILEAQELPRGVVLKPEQSLIGAMLHRAYLDVYIYRRKIGKPKSKWQKYDKPEDPTDPSGSLEKLLGWFKSDSEDPFSFLWCCYEFDPGWHTLPDLIRKAITKPRIEMVLMRRMRKVKKVGGLTQK